MNHKYNHDLPEALMSDVGNTISLSLHTDSDPETKKEDEMPEWSRFVTIVKKQHKLDEVSYHKLFDILKQYQNEVNKLRAERLARNANPLALVATAQANQDPYYQTSSSEEDSYPKQAQRDKDIQKNLALIAKYFKKIYKPTNNNLRTSSNSRNKNVDMTSWYKNDDHSGQFRNQKTECRKPKRVKDSAYHKEKMLLCKQAKQDSGIDSKLVEQVQNDAGYNVFANHLQHSEQSKFNDQNDVESDDERVAFANLIDNLKLDVDENKKIQKQLKKANTTLAQELKERKAILSETSKSLGESISVRDSFLVALQTKQTEFEKYKDFNDCTIDYDKLKHADVPSQQELDLLFGPLYDEFFNAGSNPQDKQPSTNIPSTSSPSTHIYVHAEENTDHQAEEREHLQDDEFTNPLCAPTQEEAKSSSHNIEQVRGNPSRPVQTRRQLATDLEMCMYALTVSTTKPKNIKEEMANSVWIEAMQEELHQFDRLQVKEKQENDKIGTKPDRKREAWKSSAVSKANHSQESKKREDNTKFKGPNLQILEVVYIQEQKTRGEFAIHSKSSSKPSCDQTSNLTSSTNTTPKGRIRKSSKQKVENSNFKEHLPPVAKMADNRTMAEMLRAPTEGCAEAIVVPSILAEQFELKHSLINMMTSEQFFGLEKDNPHDHIRGNLLEKSPQDALTIIENKSKVRNSRSKPIASPVNACDISSTSEIAKLTHAVNQQMSVVTTAMTTMLKQLQATPPPAPVKAVEEIYITCGAASNYNQGNPGYHPQGVANQMRPPGFGQPNVQKNHNRFGQPQSFNRGTNFNHEQPYQATAQSNQNFHLNELEKIKRMNDVSMKAMQNQIDMVKNELRNEIKTSIQTSLSNQTNEIKNMMASLLQINTASTSGSGSLLENTVANPKGELKAITTRSGLVTNGPTIPTLSKSITPEVDERVEETCTDPDLTEYTIKQEKDEVQIQKFWHMFKQLHLNITLAKALVLMPKYQKMLKALLSNKKKLQELANTPLNENCSAVILKKLPKKLGDPGKFLISCGFSELKCKALADLGASINLMPLSVWKKLADFVIVAYESDPRVPLILGRPFLRTARALIDVYSEEMILRDGDERLTLNMKHDTASYSNHPHRESVNLINIFNVSSEDCLEVLVSNTTSGNPTFSLHQAITLLKVTHEIHDSEGCNFLSKEFPDIDSFNDIYPHFDDNPLSGSTTYSSNSLLEEFTDELAFITYPLDYDDNLQFDIESDLREIEFLLYQGKDSSLKDSIDQTDLANLDAYFNDPTPEMFNDEHAPDYSSPSRFDVYDDDFLEVESDADNVYDDPFDSKGEKIKESKLLIDELDLPCDFLPYSEYDSFNSQYFSRDDDLPSPNNEDK
nr:hypothetical protein [Tanacetum cinerariifolium]